MTCMLISDVKYTNNLWRNMRHLFALSLKSRTKNVYQALYTYCDVLSKRIALAAKIAPTTYIDSKLLSGQSM